MRSPSSRLLLSLLALGTLALPARAFENEVDVGPIRNTHGHGVLTAAAARGTAYEADALVLVQGQWEQDFPNARPPQAVDAIPVLGFAELWAALVAGVDGSEQKKHFLRYWSGLPEWRSTGQPLVKDWADAVGYFRDEVKAAKSGKAGSLLRLGHALHALQDSFSPAHVTRDAAGRILDMGYYPGRGPMGHALIGEHRDDLLDASGSLVPLAVTARDVSHELLLGLGPIKPGDDAALDRYLDEFVGRHLALQQPAPTP